VEYKTKQIKCPITFFFFFFIYFIYFLFFFFHVLLDLSGHRPTNRITFFVITHFISASSTRARAQQVKLVVTPSYINRMLTVTKAVQLSTVSLKR
jgi:hypothetical protein